MIYIFICVVDDILFDIGVVVCVGGCYVVVFCVGCECFYVIDNIDLCFGVSVLVCGFVGSLGECIVVVFLFYKNYFDFVIGECLEVFE